MINPFIEVTTNKKVQVNLNNVSAIERDESAKHAIIVMNNKQVYNCKESYDNVMITVNHKYGE